jgi:hypothetical protein
MKKFIFTCILFSFPVIALFIFPLVIFLKSGEGLPISTVVNIQQNSSKDILYLSGFTNAYDKYYKNLTTIKRNPEIIVFGTSKTLTFKSNFFKNPDTFYNAGYNFNAFIRTTDLLSFINTVPIDSNLRYILFDVNGFLNSQNTEISNNNNDIFNAAHLFLTTGWHDIYNQFLRGKIFFDKFKISPSNIGFTAIMRDFGYTKDGNLDRGNEQNRRDMQKTAPMQIADEISTINNPNLINSLSFVGATISKENLDNINKFLEICKSRNIYVVGYFSTHPKEIHNVMLSLKNDYGETYRNSPKILSSIFEKYNYHFYDARDIDITGSYDSEFYDGYHPTEKATIRLLIYLANKEPSLKSYVDISKLKKQIKLETF